MKEIITDELVEYFGVCYKNYVEFANSVEEPFVTFKEYVENKLRLRNGKVVEFINGKEQEAK